MDGSRDYFKRKSFPIGFIFSVEWHCILKCYLRVCIMPCVFDNMGKEMSENMYARVNYPSIAFVSLGERCALVSKVKTNLAAEIPFLFPCADTLPLPYKWP